MNTRLEARKAGQTEATQPPADAADKPPVTDSDAPNNDGKPAADPRENDPAYWRQRFNVTQGMLRTLQESVRTADGEKDREITELRERVRTLEATKTTSATNEADLAMFFTPDQIERFGEDQCKAMAETAVKAARQAAQQMIDNEVKPIQAKAKASAAQADEAKEAEFWEKLTELAPQWQAVNETDDWKVWLADKDSGTGLVRQDILDRHRGARNAIGVAKMFENFEKAKSRPQPPVAPPRTAAGGQNDGQTQNTPALGYPTPQEVKDHYKAAKLGKLTDQERAAFEARLRLKASA